MAAYGSSPLSTGQPDATLSPSGSNIRQPMMRRKSSAGNLLTTFKSSPAGSQNPSPSPTPTPLYPLSPPATMSLFNFNLPPGAAPAGQPRDWDSQSGHGHDNLSTILGPSPIHAQGTTTTEYLRDTMQKRIVTLTYVRNVHEGKSHWFHTILLTRFELSRAFNNIDMKKRTKRFAILGMSLSNLLDINIPNDFLRGLISTLNEYETVKEDTDKPKMRLFRQKGSSKRSGGLSEWSTSYGDGVDGSYLITPHIPFPLDYHEVLMSLIDILSEIYAKISRMLGPSPFTSHLPASTPQHMMGPLGLLSPAPGVSYVFSGMSSDDPAAGDSSSLWNIANAGQQSQGGLANPTGMGSPPGAWTTSMGDLVMKVDAKIKKVTSALLKDLDELARNGIKDELASLDPLLRNMSHREAHES